MHELYPSVIEQSLIVAFFDPSFFKNTFKFNEFFLHPDTPSNIETIQNSQKRETVLKFVYQWITENSPPVVETLVVTANLFLLQNC